MVTKGRRKALKEKELEETFQSGDSTESEPIEMLKWKGIEKPRNTVIKHDKNIK